MRNIVLIIIEAIICYIFLTMLTKKYKTDGIYMYAIIATILSLILNLKRISIMEVSIPLGLGVTTSILIGANLIVQKLGKEEIKKYMMIVLLTSIACCTIIILSSYIESSNYSFLSNQSYNNIFKQNINIYIALIISIIFSIWVESKLYYTIKKLKNKIILSNIFAIIITEFFENIIFVLIAYLLEYEPLDLFLCIIIRYLIKTVIGLVGTLPLYISNLYNQ